jgi:hypothetical protein
MELRKLNSMADYLMLQRTTLTLPRRIARSATDIRVRPVVTGFWLGFKAPL